MSIWSPLVMHAPKDVNAKRQGSWEPPYACVHHTVLGYIIFRFIST